MKKVVIFALLIFLVVGVITTCSVKKVDELTDQEKIANEYDISSDNPYVYITLPELKELLNQGTGFVLFANSDEEGSKKAVPMILKEAKKQEIKKIYYYNPKLVSKSEKKDYQELLDKIRKDLQNEEYKVKRPSLYAIKNGKVVNYSDYFSKQEELSDEYLTKKVKKKIEQKYEDIFTYKECTEC